MIRFVAARLLQAVPTLLGVIVVTFGILYVIPGDPVKLLASGFETSVSGDVLNKIREKYGLNDPLPVQFVHYVLNVLHGDLGTSVILNRPVAELIAENLPHTLEIAVTAMVVAIPIGVGLGVLSATRRGKLTDRISIFVTLMGISMPQFWVAIMAIIVFAVKLQWFPAFGVTGVESLVLPSAVLGLGAATSIARLTRSSMLDVLNKQYVMTARAKGMSEPYVIGFHALKNALIPVVTLLGLQFGNLISGAIIVETVFARPGIGTLLINAILNKDIPLLRGTVLVVATGYVLINLLVDVSYGWFDPRISYD